MIRSGTGTIVDIIHGGVVGALVLTTNTGKRMSLHSTPEIICRQLRVVFGEHCDRDSVIGKRVHYVRNYRFLETLEPATA